MPGEPSNTELAWRLDSIQRVLGELVSRAEYVARLEATERRFTELSRTVDRLERKHDDDMKDHEKDHAENQRSWREILWPMAGAAAGSAAAIVVQLMTSGGH